MKTSVSNINKGVLAPGNDLFRTLTETTSCAIFVVRKTFLYVNPAALAISGYSEEELLALSSWDEIIAPEHRDFVKSRGLARLQGEDIPARYEFKILHKNGEERWLDYTAERIDYEGSSAILGTAFDITDRRRTEEKLRHSEDKFSKSFHSSPAMIAISTADEGVFVDINETFQLIFGYTREQVIGKSSLELGIWKNYEDRQQTLGRVKRDGSVRGVEFPFLTSKGEERYLFGSAELVNFEGAMCLLMVAQDITEKRLHELEVVQREERIRRQQQALLALAKNEATSLGDTEVSFRMITRTASDALNVARVGIWLYDESSHSIVCAYQHDRREQDAIKGNALFMDDVPDYYKAIESNLLVTIENVAEDERTQQFPREYFIDNGIGAMLDAAIRIDGKFAGVLCHEHVGTARAWTLEEENFVAALAEMVTHVLDQKHKRKTEEDLYREQGLAQITLQSIGDGVVTTDMQGNVEYINPVAEELTGWKNREAIGKSFKEVFNLIDEETRFIAPDPVGQCIEKGRNIRLNSQPLLIHRDGDTEYSLEITASPIRNSEGSIIGAVLVFHDVTELRGLARQLAHQAAHDDLTGLANRREFEQRLELVLRHASQYHTQHVMCYLDLDQFKVVNDSCGHVAGDELLKQIASGLQHIMREQDTLARLGGDEFGILIKDGEIEPAKDIAERARKYINDFRFSWEDKVFEVGVSVGLVVINEQSGSLTDVLSAADSACYVAKDLGRNRVHVFEPDDIAIAERYGEMEWLQKINRAFEDDRFQLYYQTIVPLSERAKEEGAHCELLLRMQDLDGQLLMPQSFINAAERYHIMPTLDRWVIRTALVALGRTDVRQEIGTSTFAINLSGQSLGDAMFLNFVTEQLDQSSVDPERICFEITETAAIANFSLATHFISTLKEKGCRFALDDFGRGLSSFTYLKNLPVDYLKIDGSFVLDIIRDPIDYAMVEAINHLGHVMGKFTVAEAVENETILEMVKDLGADYAQGVGLSRPRPITSLL